MHTLYLFLAMLPVMVAGDLLWLGVIMKDFYRANLGHLMADAIAWAPAVVFYLVFVAGLLYFAVLPNFSAGFWHVVFASALLGAFAYATYDLTNHATLKNWPLVITVVDIAWGAFLSGVLGAFAFLVASWMK